ncbi:energy transducer TonB [Flavobacterium sp.]|jgi:protein TonB|uniref:energy transducer TonB n=1 Tax=Flavobacterium sp. TaxID=239 RepID=UPI0037C0CCCE
MILETKYEKRSLGITVVVFIVLFICFYFYVLKDDPNVPYVFKGGEIAINFGTSETGNGDIQPIEKVQTAPEPVVNEAVETPAQKITTQTKVKAAAVPTATTPSEAPPTPTPPKRKTNSALNSILKGPKTTGTTQTGHGDDNDGGDKGSVNGSLYANMTYGDGTGDGKGTGKGTGWGLSGRKLYGNSKKIQDCNESGKVVVKIWVNRQGNVIRAERSQGTTNTNPCLVNPAIETAKTFKWQSDSNAPETQIGFVVVNFQLGE